ncbi:MAG: hypothetical protein IPJ32_06195 [Sphingobacteriaceae bacterium]|nr:hypothetical protein [Sphingobacteriaceae bacterium]
MQSKAKTPKEYIDSLPADRKKPMGELRKVIKKNLSKEYSETMAYGMLMYCVPLKIYPAGYHCDPTLPLGYMSLASLLFANQQSNSQTFLMAVLKNTSRLCTKIGLYGTLDKNY